MAALRIFSTRKFKALNAGGWAIAFSFSLLSPLLGSAVATAQTNAYCQLAADVATQKEQLRQAALQGDRTANDRYKTMLGQHAQLVQQCRNQHWLRNQAIWLRLYPCDAQPGVLEALLDDIVNRGYNQVYVEVFYNGQVLLPAAENTTPWQSVLRTPGYERRDLLAEAIAKGHERGLKVYAWLFTLNFGYTYAQRPDAQSVLARNGYGQNSLTFRSALGMNTGGLGVDEVFVDPYSTQAKSEYYYMVEAIARRRPDGMLFDYIRYPRGEGGASVASRVQDLWVYGSASQQALYARALNRSGQDLIRRYLNQGHITVNDVVAIANLYPDEPEPLWQGRVSSGAIASFDPAQIQSLLQTQLWQLSVAHATQGILDFLSLAVYPAQQQGITAGAVFFPEGNQTVGSGGYDSRLQPWERFPTNIEWHPMSYGTCGNTSCITAQVQRVLSMAPAGTRVQPVLAGTWGQPISNRPSLEAQMQAIRQVAPQINSISHFAYSWQNPQSDRERKFCQL